MRSGSGAAPAAPGSGAPWIWGCLIISRHGRCLVNCLTHRPPGVTLHIRQLCNMLVAVQGLAGGTRSCFLALSHYSVGLARRAHFVVAVLAPPGAASRSVELRAEQIAHSFAFYHGQQVATESIAEEAEAEKRLSSYTVHDVLRNMEGREGAPSGSSAAGNQTQDTYLEFEELYLRQVLKAPNYSRMWLSTLASVPGVRRAALVAVNGPAVDMLGDEKMNYRPSAPGQGGISRRPAMAEVGDIAGPCGGLVWQAALAGCRHLAEGRKQAAASLGKLPDYLTLALKEFQPPIMVFIKAVQLLVAPSEACLMVFYQDEGTGGAGVSPREERPSSAVPLPARVSMLQGGSSGSLRVGQVGQAVAERVDIDLYGLAFSPRGRLGEISPQGTPRSSIPTASPRQIPLDLETRDREATPEEVLAAAAISIMRESIMLPSTDRQAPVMPQIVRHALQVAAGHIRGAFPQFSESGKGTTRARRESSARQLQLQEGAVSSYHQPQPPSAPSGQAFRRSSVGPGRIKSPQGSRRQSTERATRTAAGAPAGDISGRPIVPRLPLAKLKAERGEERQPTKAAAMGDASSSSDDSSGSSISLGAHLRVRTPSWVSTKRREEERAVSQRSSASTASVTPRREDTSGQWYMSPRASPARTGDSTDARRASMVPRPKEKRREEEGEDARRHTMSAHQASSSLASFLRSSDATQTQTLADTPQARGVAGRPSRTPASPVRGGASPVARGSPVTPRGTSLRAMAAASALERQLRHSQELLKETAPVGSLRERYHDRSLGRRTDPSERSRRRGHRQ